MALNKDIILENGLIVSYHRIESISTGLDQVSCVASLGSYKDRHHREMVFFPVITHKIGFIKKTDNVQQDAYEHIKSLPNWAGAIDV